MRQVGPLLYRPVTCRLPLVGPLGDLVARNLVPDGYLSGLKARLLLGFSLRTGKGAGAVAEAFAPYQ
jgi:hypothetical protein